MTRHTQAIVLRQSVVSSIGKVLFCNIHYMGNEIPVKLTRVFFILKNLCLYRLKFGFYLLASETNLVVALLKVFNMGVASA